MNSRKKRSRSSKNTRNEAWIHMHISKDINRYIHEYIYIYICTYIYVHVHVYIHICIHICIYIYLQCMYVQCMYKEYVDCLVPNVLVQRFCLLIILCIHVYVCVYTYAVWPIPKFSQTWPPRGVKVAPDLALMFNSSKIRVLEYPFQENRLRDSLLKVPTVCFAIMK